MSPRDEILPLFYAGQRVRLIKDIHNDGTYPFAKIGELLVKAGDEGYIRKIGDFLQVIRVYEIEFLNAGAVFGCREEELEAVDDGIDEVKQELEWLKNHRANSRQGGK